MLGRIGAVVMALVSLILAAIPIALTAIAVWLVLGRPLLFRQERLGLGMRPFTIRKFRTMLDTCDVSGALLPDHMRVTGITRLIRAIHTDELPQIFAIVRGDMTFIGPRPLPQFVMDKFGEFGAVRCSVRPGLTGWAQVNGGTKLSDPQKLALAIWYIDNRNVLLDLSILFRTIGVMVFGERLRPHWIEVAEANMALRKRNPSAAVPA